jgi:hypothetical protein
MNGISKNLAFLAIFGQFGFHLAKAQEASGFVNIINVAGTPSYLFAKAGGVSLTDKGYPPGSYTGAFVFPSGPLRVQLASEGFKSADINLMIRPNETIFLFVREWSEWDENLQVNIPVLQTLQSGKSAPERGYTYYIIPLLQTPVEGIVANEKPIATDTARATKINLKAPRLVVKHSGTSIGGFESDVEGSFFIPIFEDENGNLRASFVPQ